MKRILHFLILTACMAVGHAAERTILVGPKTIGPGWRDNIVIKAEQFQGVAVGDIITVYNDRAKGNAQGAFQDPKDWKGIAPEYNYFGIAGPFRMTVTEEILPKLQERGLGISGHDYRIVKVTHTPAADIKEHIVWRGPAKQMKDDWSVYADIQASTFKDLQLGDGIRLHVSKVVEGAAVKVCDFTYNAIDNSLNGAPVGAEGFTYYVTDAATLVRFAQLQNGEGISVRISGKGYRLDKIGVVRQVGGVDADESKAQHCPPEYILGPGELFRGEKEFPMDWTGNLRLTAEPFQECTSSDCLVMSYQLLPDLNGEQAQVSLREQRKWKEITGAEEPIWITLDGSDVVYPLDSPVALDHIKTKGVVITGRGFVLTKVELIHVGE